MGNPKHYNLEEPGFELFILEEGEKKINEEVVTGMANCSDFILKKEDHTLGNLLSEYLKQSQHVLMAAYKIGHPNVPEVQIRVQTDGTVTPKEAVIDVCNHLVRVYGQLQQEFTREWAFREAAASAQGNDGSGAANGHA